MSSAGDTQQSSRVQGARVSSALLCPMESVGPGAKTACVALWIRGALGLWFAAGGVFPFAECSCQKLVWGHRCDGTLALSGRAGSGGLAGAWAQKAFARPILLPHEGEPVGSGFRAPENPSKAAGPREPGQPSPGSPYGERRAGGENGLLCFLDPRRVGAVVCCPRRVSLCRMHLPEARFGPSVRRGLGAERPSWLKGHGWGCAQKAFARPILLPHEGEPVGSGFPAPETPSKAAGPREPGQPCRGSLYGERGAGGEKGLPCFLDPQRVGVVVCCQGEFPFAGCSSQKLVLGLRCDGASALSGRAGSGGMAGAWAQKAFVRPVLLAHEGEPVGSGFRAPETPSKAAVPRSQGELSSASPYGERRAGGENSLC